MLQVDRCSAPPLTSSSRHHAQLYPRRVRHVEQQRGRSRDVSKTAIARRRSEERRAALLEQQEALARARVVGCYQTMAGATSFPDAPSCVPHPPLSSDNAPSLSTPGASSSAVKLPPITSTRPSPRSHSPQPLSNAMDSSSAANPHSSSSCAVVRTHESPSNSRRICTSSSPLLSQPGDVLPQPADLAEDADQEFTLPEEMQRAYARCQITCPTPAANDSHTCPDMKRARILFLRTQGIEVTSDDDPRIAKVCDEDFVFGDEKTLELDEDYLRSLEEEQVKRAGLPDATNLMTCGFSQDVRNYRLKESPWTRDERCPPLEMKSRKQKETYLGSSNATKEVSSFSYNNIRTITAVRILLFL